MKIGQFVAQQQLVTVRPEQTLAEAAREMIRHRVGSAVVIAGDEPPGIITERDLLRAIADGVDFDLAKVGQYMVAKAVTVTERWHVVDAAGTMMERGFRRWWWMRMEKSPASSRSGIWSKPCSTIAGKLLQDELPLFEFNPNMRAHT